MKEMNEIHLGDGRISLRDSHVKTGILPHGSKELGREVAFQGNVVVDGAVYGQNIIIENGPARFDGAVYAHNEAS